MKREKKVARGPRKKQKKGKKRSPVGGKKERKKRQGDINDKDFGGRKMHRAG